jgi:hypothetical protein
MGIEGGFLGHVRGPSWRPAACRSDARRTAFGEAELCYDGVSGGWQVSRLVARFNELPAGFFNTLCVVTGAPVLAADRRRRRRVLGHRRNVTAAHAVSYALIVVTMGRREER